MRRFVCSFFVLVFWLAPGLAQAAPPVWIVQGKPGHALVLFGTVHLLPPGTPWQSPALVDALSRADRLALELDFSAPGTQEAVARGLFQRGLLTDGRTLDQLVPPPVYEQVLKLASENSLPPQAVRRFRPWLAAIVLGQAAIGKQGFDASQGVELTLLGMRRAGHPPVIGLETPDEQIGLFAGLDDQRAAEMLGQSLKEIDTVAERAQKMVTAWMDGDLDRLHHLLLDAMKDTPDLYDSVIVARNRRWLPRLDALLDQPGLTLVAVGAGHMLGPDGLVALLEAGGHTVQRLDEKGADSRH